MCRFGDRWSSVERVFEGWSTPAVNSAATQAPLVCTPGGDAEVVFGVDRQTLSPALTARVDRQAVSFCPGPLIRIPLAPVQAPRSEHRAFFHRTAPAGPSCPPNPTCATIQGATRSFSLCLFRPSRAARAWGFAGLIQTLSRLRCDCASLPAAGARAIPAISRDGGSRRRLFARIRIRFACSSGRVGLDPSPAQSGVFAVG